MSENLNLQIQELLLLQRVAQRINSILDLDVLLEEVVSDVAQTFGYSRSGILLKVEDTNELEIVAVRGWTVNFHIKGDRFKIGEYGMVGHVGLTGETYYAPDVTKDPYYQISEESTNSELDIPLKIRGKLIGVFNFQHQETNAFSPGRIQLLEALAGHVSTAIENARLFKIEREEKDRMARELDEAKTVQLSLFPNWKPELPGYEVEGLCIPCREVGGDWFDYIQLDKGKLGIVLADVAGKGMAAALLMASTRSILRMFAEKGLSPAEVLTEVNKVLVQDFPKTRFVTMIYAILDTQSGTFKFANAGHLSPLLINSNEIKTLEANSGLPLGLMEYFFTDEQIELKQGNRLLLFSDGVSEAMNSSFEEYGLDRIQKHMEKSESSIQTLLDDVHTFTAGQPASDDITLLIIGSK
ncbi:MAG: serine phosphatase [Ignavibacteriaceae bacterium]|nr:serine phosphatase [Ignavibacteriaceae bacterium]